MSDFKQGNPFQGDQPSSDEYGFEEGADPLHKDEAQAEASEYGIYGYATESGEAFEGDPGEGTSAAPRPPVNENPDIRTEMGGQAWDETEHGSGFAQPNRPPQRHASDSEQPGPTDDD